MEKVMEIREYRESLDVLKNMATDGEIAFKVESDLQLYLDRLDNLKNKVLQSEYIGDVMIPVNINSQLLNDYDVVSEINNKTRFFGQLIVGNLTVDHERSFAEYCKNMLDDGDMNNVLGFCKINLAIISPTRRYLLLFYGESDYSMEELNKRHDGRFVRNKDEMPKDWSK